MREVHLGYVGCGFMAQKVHLPNFTSIPGCRLVALAELRQELGRKVQARFSIPKLYSDHQALLADPDVEAVAVSAAFSVQGEIARDALLAGKDVFMEKPMAVSLAQADAILDAAEQSGRRVMVGYMNRMLAQRPVCACRLRPVRGGRLSPIVCVAGTSRQLRRGRWNGAGTPASGQASGRRRDGARDTLA